MSRSLLKEFPHLIAIPSNLKTDKRGKEDILGLSGSRSWAAFFNKGFWFQLTASTIVIDCGGTAVSRC